MYRIRTGAASLAALAVLALAVSAAPASAKTVTLHYFSKQVFSTSISPNGQPVSQNAPPAVGDRLEFASDDYVGNHKKHAKTPTASDHVVCSIATTTSTSATALCSGDFALGGSEVIAANFTLVLSQNNAASGPIKINGGTGRYKHAHGTVTVKSVGNTNNNDETVTITT
jgi:hypothetical protein